MNLAGLQGYVLSRLQAATALQGVTILAHDGTDGFIETSKERQRALNEPGKGIAITVLPIIAKGLIQPGGTGESPASIVAVALAVLIEENVRLNRSQGLNLPAETVLETVMASVIGEIQSDSSFGASIGFDDPPFDNLGNKAGVQAYLAQFSFPLVITPTS